MDERAAPPGGSAESDHNSAAVPPPSPPYDLPGLTGRLAGFSEAFDAAVRDMHRMSAARPLELHGAFPSSLLADVPPVVVDANVLRGDIFYACRHGGRTTLTNAANAGAIRIYCAQHVVDEVAEHSGEWTEGTEVAKAVFIHRWATQYLPLVRIVAEGGVGDEMLHPDERARIDQLRVGDPDDVPSATLALALGAFFLTKDKRAWRAVYGRDADPGEHELWVEVLRAGGDAGQLGMVVNVASNVSAIVAGGIANGAQWLTRRLTGWVWLPVAAGAIVWWFKTRPETRQRIQSGGGTTALAVLQAFADYQKRLERFRAAEPATPSWEELRSTTDRRALLARACVRTLARSSRSDRSVEELAAMLPELGVGQSEGLVRGVLRGNGCFVEAGSGRWQVGGMHPGIRPYIAHELQRRDAED